MSIIIITIGSCLYYVLLLNIFFELHVVTTKKIIENPKLNIPNKLISEIKILKISS